MSEKLVLGIDASRCRSGGAIAHIIGILSCENPANEGVKEIHVWAYQSLLDKIPNKSWLVKHCPDELEQGLWKQIFWQIFKFSKELENVKCDVLFSASASTFCRFKPMVVLSQDMLSYEPGIMQQFGYGLARLRLQAILILQNLAFRRSDGVIFLTKYASETIQKSCGPLKNVEIVPHGVSQIFLDTDKKESVSNKNNRSVRCLYISNAALYKHQWVVVQAIEKLRQNGCSITLELVGGGRGKAQQLLEKQLAISDPDGDFVSQIPFVPQSQIPNYLAEADIFVFASSCENLPITLIEAMAVGLPIACSNRGPMPDILGNGGIYFDPEDTDSIADAVEQIVNDSQLQNQISKIAKETASAYSWARCSQGTWKFLIETCQKKVR